MHASTARRFILLYGVTASFCACLDQVPHDRSNCIDGVYDVEGGVIDVSEIPETFLGCHTIDGSVTVHDGAADVRILRGITDIRGSLRIQSLNLESLEGLERLERVTGFVEISKNRDLRSIELPALKEVGALYILGNPAITDLTGLNSLERVTSVEGVGLLISGNDALEFVVGFDNLRHTSTIEIVDNPSLQVIDGFSAMTEIFSDPAVQIAVSPVARRLEAFNAVTALHGGVILQDLESLTDVDIFEVEPLGAQNLTVRNVGLSYCEALVLQRRLHLDTADFALSDSECSVELQPISQVVRPGTPLRLDWAVRGFPSDATQVIEWGTDPESAQGRSMVSAPLARTAEVTAPDIDGVYTYRVTVSTPKATASATTLVDVFADRPPRITIETSSVVAGFPVDVVVTIDDPDGDAVNVQLDPSPTAGTLEYQGVTTWRYRSPPQFRGVDTVQFVARSTNLTTTATVGIEVGVGRRIELGDVNGLVEISGDATYAFFGSGNSLTRRDLASGALDTPQMGELTYGSISAPRASENGNHVLFTALTKAVREVFYYDFERRSGIQLTHGNGPTATRTYAYGHELGASGAFGVFTTRARIVASNDGELNVYRAFFPRGGDANIESLTSEGPANGGASIAESGAIAFATRASSVLGDGPGVVRHSLGAERVDQPVTGGVPTSPGTYPSISGDGLRIVFASTAVLTSTATADGRMRVYVSDNRMLSQLVEAEVRTPGDLRLTKDGQIVAIRTTTSLTEADADDEYDLYALTIDDGSIVLLTDGTDEVPDGLDAFAVDRTGQRYLLRHRARTYLRSIW